MVPGVKNAENKKRAQGYKNTSGFFEYSETVIA
jgi:hypothetical protein